ncbi:hypothetical protein ACEPAI_4509 [Sanghuangporus weigelae]
MVYAHRQVFTGLAVIPLLVSALKQNVSVDDAAASGVIPQYLPPSGAWKQGADCPDCFAQPDPSQIFNGTWHDATFTPTDGSARAVEFTFNGTALYVFFILANTVPFTDTVTNMNFILDEETVGSFVHQPTNSSDFEYNVPVYVNDSLSFGQHHMRMEAVGNHSALILFDYFIYTSDVDEASSTSSSPSAASSTAFPAPDDTRIPQPKSSIGPIIGGVVSGVVGLCLVMAALLCCWNRKKHGRGVKMPDRIMNQRGHGDDIYISASAVDDAPHLFGAIPTPYRDVPAAGNHKSNPKNLADQLDAGSGSEARAQPSSDQSNARSETDHDTGMLRERVEFLMDEVARLRHLHLQDRNAYETGSEAPPGYSEGRISPDSFR